MAAPGAEAVDLRRRIGRAATDDLAPRNTVPTDLERFFPRIDKAGALNFHAKMDLIA